MVILCFRLMLGFMLTTAFISMWITNTATTAMMTPIMEAVLKELDKEYMSDAVEEENEEEVNGNAGDVEATFKDGIKDLNKSELEEKKNALNTEEVELKELGLHADRTSWSGSTKQLVEMCVNE